MSKMVTARVPDELYFQGDEKLAALNLGATDLIRAAYQYVVETGMIPLAHKDQSSVPRVLSEAQRDDLSAKLNASRLPCVIPADWDYREAMAEGKWGDYEALA